MGEAERRGATRKAGPRVLTYCMDSADPDISQPILVNCPGCAGPPVVSGPGAAVTGEFVPGEADLLDPAPLPHGWYTVKAASCLAYVQQLNPADACAADPLRGGEPLFPGEEMTIFVDSLSHDSILAVVFCPDLEPPEAVSPPATAPPAVPTVDFPVPCNAPCFCVVTVNRRDTILSAAATGDDANAIAPEPSPAGSCSP
jgi:hypothetical protein